MKIEVVLVNSLGQAVTLPYKTDSKRTTKAGAFFTFENWCKQIQCERYFIHKDKCYAVNPGDYRIVHIQLAAE